MGKGRGRARLAGRKGKARGSGRRRQGSQNQVWDWELGRGNKIRQKARWHVGNQEQVKVAMSTSIRVGSARRRAQEHRRHGRAHTRVGNRGM